MAAWVERYVSVSGAGAHDGTSEANAWTWAEMKTNLANGQRANLKKGTYTLTTSQAFSNGSITSRRCIRGYNSSIGDGDQGHNADGTLDTTNMPTINMSGTSVYMSSGNYNQFEHFVFTHSNYNQSTAPIWLGTDGQIRQCSVTLNGGGGSSSAALRGNGRARIIDCDVTDNATTSTAAIESNHSHLISDCRITSANNVGIDLYGDDTHVKDCTIKDCGSHGIDEISNQGYSMQVTGCTIINNTGDGIRNSQAQNFKMFSVYGNVITDNGGYGLNNVTSETALIIQYNYFDRNTSGSINGIADDESTFPWRTGNVDAPGNATSDDFVDYAGDDFTLKSGSGAVGIVGSKGLNAGAWPEEAAAGGGTNVTIPAGSRQIGVQES